MDFDKYDVIGNKFNMIEVISYSHEDKILNHNGFNYYYYCKCNCGNPKYFLLSRKQIVNKTTKNCGCNKEKRSRMNHRLGEEIINNQGLNMKIIRYGGNRDIDIKFDDGLVLCNKNYDSFKIGTIENLKFPRKDKIGYLGIGKYNFTDYKQIYTCWTNMIDRCYDEKEQLKCPSYKGCCVCRDWHNYQNFAKWYEENYWGHNLKLQLDKDILIKGNKEYSPNNCVFVNKYINCLFTKSNNTRGEFPIGVSLYDVKDEKYMARYNENGKLIKIGVYLTPNEAFNAYKLFKEKYIKEIADEYKSKHKDFPTKLYNAMYSYEVEITD